MSCGFFCKNWFWLAGALGGMTNGITSHPNHPNDPYNLINNPNLVGNIAAIIDDSYFQNKIPMSSTTVALMVSMITIIIRECLSKDSSLSDFCLSKQVA